MSSSSLICSAIFQSLASCFFSRYTLASCDESRGSTRNGNYPKVGKYFVHVESVDQCTRELRDVMIEIKVSDSKLSMKIENIRVFQLRFC